MEHSKLPWKNHLTDVYSGEFGDGKRIALGCEPEDAEFIRIACNEYDTLKAKADLSQRFVWLWNEMRSGYDAGITFKHMDKFEALVKQVEALT